MDILTIEYQYSIHMYGLYRLTMEISINHRLSIGESIDRPPVQGDPTSMPMPRLAKPFAALDHPWKDLANRTCGGADDISDAWKVLVTFAW